jgi:hypothetical protein
MATTTNYGWDTPDDTDLVKDGALAMRDLGQDVDTSLFSITGGKNVGAQFISATSVTAASLVQVNNCFTSAYNNYLVTVSYIQNTSAASLNYQNTLSGTPAATTYGSNGFAAYASGSSSNLLGSAGSSQNDTKITVSNTAVDFESYASLDIANPNLTRATLVFSNYISRGSGAGGNTAGFVGGTHNTATAYDGFRLTVDAGTMTGTVRVYGLRNS